MWSENANINIYIIFHYANIALKRSGGKEIAKLKFKMHDAHSHQKLIKLLYSHVGMKMHIFIYWISKSTDRKRWIPTNFSIESSDIQIPTLFWIGYDFNPTYKTVDFLQYVDDDDDDDATQKRTKVIRSYIGLAKVLKLIKFD